MSIKNIEVVSYNSKWPEMFENEAKLIRQALGENYIDIHHIGSTAVPGLAAKPKIDIIGVVKEPSATIELLASIGYEYKGEYNIPFHFGFSKRGSTDVNLHIYAEGNPEIELNLLFRDYLRSHPEELNEYAQLKTHLLTQPSSFVKDNSMFTGYNLGKDAFIQKILQNAGFDKLRMHHCAHYKEWETAKIFRQKYFFDKVPMPDPYTWTFAHKDHIHFVLYLATQIIGYVHIVLWPEQRSALRIIVIDEPYRKQGFGGQFLVLCERWLKSQNKHVLQTEASPAAKKFYLKHGYLEMPFNDPEGHETHVQDTAMGKIL